MIDEGYTKYHCDWRQTPALPAELIVELNTWRNRLYHEGLIGYYKRHGVGYGNVSIREGDSNQFIVSGTQTGHIAHTDETHYSRVTACDIETNHVSCEGPVQASSEALTHAAIYALDPAILAVVHVHDHGLWHRLMFRVPSTSYGVAYGTPEMAREFVRLYRETEFAREGIAQMAGHEDGVITFGRSIGIAAQRALRFRLAPTSRV
jgi:hypothetical protein